MQTQTGAHTSAPVSGEDARRVISDRLQRGPQKSVLHALRPRALTASRLQNWIAVGGFLLGTGVVLGPWMWGEYKELFGYTFVPVAPSTMPRTSPSWWENEWRKMNVWWRRGESTDDFYVKPYRFVQSHTGRDMFSARAFAQSLPSTGTESVSGPTRPSRVRLAYSFLCTSFDALHRRGGNESEGTNVMKADSCSPSHSAGDGAGCVRALVPLCGDSPIVGVLARQGYRVDAVDCAETAIRAAVERAERVLPVALYDRVCLHWSDIFSSELWHGALAGKRYDVIYERQGMPSLNREQREDYAFLLKQALKEDGVMYMEGIYRTGRVKGNKLRGPPYSLTRGDMARLFPQSEGYFVRCEEKPDMLRSLSRENRILQRVPKEQYAVPFSCVVFREAAVNLMNRDHTLYTDLRGQNVSTPICQQIGIHTHTHTR